MGVSTPSRPSAISLNPTGRCSRSSGPLLNRHRPFGGSLRRNLVDHPLRQQPVRPLHALPGSGAHGLRPVPPPGVARGPREQWHLPVAYPGRAQQLRGEDGPRDGVFLPQPPRRRVLDEALEVLRPAHVVGDQPTRFRVSRRGRERARAGRAPSREPGLRPRGVLPSSGRGPHRSSSLAGTPTFGRTRPSLVQRKLIEARERRILQPTAHCRSRRAGLVEAPSLLRGVAHTLAPLAHKPPGTTTTDPGKPDSSICCQHPPSGEPSPPRARCPRSQGAASKGRPPRRPRPGASFRGREAARSRRGRSGAEPTR